MIDETPAPGRRRHLDHHLKLRHLRAIDAVATQGSLLRASTTLGLSQPALSRSLQDSEQALDLKLFDRHARGVTPTPAGEAVWAAARRILAELGRLEEELDRLTSPIAGTVALGALPVAAVGLLPGVLAALKSSHPRLVVRLVQGRTEELLPLLASGELDLIVGRLYEPAAPDMFHRETLYDEPISVLARAGHPILAEAEPTLATLQAYELVLPTMSQRMGQEIERLLHARGLLPAHCLRSSSVGFIRELLHTTDTLTICPRMMMGGDLLRGTIRVVPLVIATALRPAGIIRNRQRGTAANAETLVQCLRDYLATLSAHGLVPLPGGMQEL
jgi:LysR family pca operon transcriptional activator